MEEKIPQIELKAVDIKEVDFFTNSETCPSCMMIHAKIMEMGQYIKVNEYDIAKSEEARAKAESIGVRNVPTIIANGIDFVGINHIVKIMHPVINLHKK